MKLFFVDLDRGSVGVFVTVTLTLISFYVSYRLANKKARFGFVFDISHLIGTERPEVGSNLEVYWCGRRIKNLQKASIIVANIGDTYLDRDRRVESDAPRITFDKAVNILEAGITKITNPNCRFTCKINDERSTIFLEFDYIDPYDAMQIEILFEGYAFPQLEGSLKGEKNAIKNLGFKGTPDLRKRGLLYFAYAILLTLAIAITIIIRRPDFLEQELRVWLVPSIVIFLFLFAIGTFVIDVVFNFYWDQNAFLVRKIQKVRDQTSVDKDG